MKVIIFGASGNSGKYITNHFLSGNWTVIGVSRSDMGHENTNFTHVKGDIRDDALYSRLPGDADLVINLAGVQPSILKTSEHTDLTATLHAYVDVNINGVFKVLEFVRRNKIPTYIYTTSHRDIENDWAPDHFLKNDLPVNINYQGDHSMYAISKTSAKMMGDYYGAAFGIRVFNLRLPMVFMIPETPFYLSDGKPVLMPFLRIIRDAISGKDLEIWGDPGMPRDYSHIDNLLSLIDLCFESDLSRGTFSIGTGEAVTTERFVKTIGAAFSSEPDKINYIYRPEKKTYKCAVYDVSEHKAVLGYQPVLLDEMIRKLKVEFEKKNCAETWGWL